MAYNNIISILIQAKDEASAVLSSTAAGVQSAADKLKSVGSSLESTGRSLTTGVTLPLLAVGAASAKLAYGFENDMELLHTNAGIAQTAIAGLSNQVLQMAGQVGQAPEALAQGLYHIASAGNGIWNTSQMMDILKVAAEGANLGMANLDDTTYSLTSAMASGVKGVGNATEMMATLNAIVGAGDMKMNDLNAAMSTGILSTAATFGISIQSVGAALATLTDNGEHADEAATRLRMTISLMSSPSTVAAKQLEALGLTAEDATNATAGMNQVFAKSGLTTTKLADDLRQPNGITMAMKDLKDHLEAAGLSASETDAMLSKAFGGGRTDAALLTMLQNTDRMDAKFKAITADTGQFAQKLNDLNATPMQRWRDATAAIQADLTRLGETVLPIVAQAIQRLANGLSVAIGWFNRLSPDLRTAIVDFAMVLAAIGPVLLAVGALTKAAGALSAAFSAVSSPVGLAVIGFLAATAAAIYLYTHFSAVRQVVDDVFHSFSVVANYMLAVLRPAWDNMTAAVQQAWSQLQPLWQSIQGPVLAGLRLLAEILLGAVAASIIFFIGMLGAAALAIMRVVQVIAMVISAFVSFGEAVWNSASTAVAAVASLYGRITGIFANAGSWLYDAGRRIVNGLASGISDAIGNVERAVGNVASRVSGDIGGALHSAHIPGFAGGGFTGIGSSNEVAGVVHKGEFVIPQSGVDQKTGLPKAAGGSTVVNNLSGNFTFNNKESVDAFFTRLDKTQRLAALGMAS